MICLWCARVCGGIQQASMLWEPAKIKLALLALNAPPALRLAAMFTEIFAEGRVLGEVPTSYLLLQRAPCVRRAASSLHTRFRLLVLLTQ